MNFNAKYCYPLRLLLICVFVSVLSLNLTVNVSAEPSAAYEQLEATFEGIRPTQFEKHDGSIVPALSYTIQTSKDALFKPGRLQRADLKALLEICRMSAFPFVKLANADQDIGPVEFLIIRLVSNDPGFFSSMQIRAFVFVPKPNCGLSRMMEIADPS